MLKPSTPEVAECYARAQEARERADSTQFLGQEPIVKHPVCKSCGVAMWLVGVKDLSTNSQRYTFECKACDLTKTETVDRRDR